EAHRDGCVDAARTLARQVDDMRDLVKRFVDASIHVASVEGVGRGDGDELVPNAVGERQLESTEIGDQHAKPSELRLQSGEHCGRVPQLWHPDRRDERCCLDTWYARVEQPADQPDLRFGADGLSDVLETV